MSRLSLLVLRLGPAAALFALFCACGLGAFGQETPGGPSPPPIIGDIPPPPASNGTGTGGSAEDLMHAWDVRTNPTMLVGCSLHGGEIYFRSIGNKMIPAGTEIHWGAPGTAQHGTFRLAIDLKPGETVSLSAMLGPAADTGACLSEIGG